MITAKEALTMTEESVKEKAIQKYESKIIEAAKDGKRRIEINDWIPMLEKKALEELGYKIDENDREYCNNGYTAICW